MTHYVAVAADHGGLPGALVDEGELADHVRITDANSEVPFGSLKIEAAMLTGGADHHMWSNPVVIAHHRGTLDHAVRTHHVSDAERDAGADASRRVNPVGEVRPSRRHRRASAVRS